MFVTEAAHNACRQMSVCMLAPFMRLPRDLKRLLPYAVAECR